MSRNVLRKMWLSVASRYGFSQSYFHVFTRLPALEMLKFIEPMLRLHISGLACSGAARRSSSVIFSPPPVVMFTTASVDCLMMGRKRMSTAGSGVGSPFSGLRAWRWMMAAPASAASMLLWAICSGVIGRCSDMLGVWIAPVTAQLMMTLAMQLPHERGQLAAIWWGGEARGW